MHCGPLVVYAWTLLCHFCVIKTLSQHSPSAVLALGNAYSDAFSSIVQTKRLKKADEIRDLTTVFKVKRFENLLFLSVDRWKRRMTKKYVKKWCAFIRKRNSVDSWKQKESASIGKYFAFFVWDKNGYLKKCLSVAKALDFYNVLFQKSDPTLWWSWVWSDCCHMLW